MSDANTNTNRGENQTPNIDTGNMNDTETMNEGEQIGNIGDKGGEAGGAFDETSTIGTTDDMMDTGDTDYSI